MIALFFLTNKEIIGSYIYNRKEVNNMHKNIMAIWKEFNPSSERSMKYDFKNEPKKPINKLLTDFF